MKWARHIFDRCSNQNRPTIIKVSKLILQQVRKPDQLVIVDQSLNEVGKMAVERLLSGFPDMELIYIRDT